METFHTMGWEGDGGHGGCASIQGQSRQSQALHQIAGAAGPRLTCWNWRLRTRSDSGQRTVESTAVEC